MALRFAGIADIEGVENDPGSLNEFMRQNNGYQGMAVHWLRTVNTLRTVTGKDLRYRLVADTEQALTDALCAGHPVIVGVNIGPDGRPGHFVLVTGVQAGQFSIVDPGFANTTLDDYNNQFQTRGFVEDPPGDLSELDLAINDAELLVIDEAGRRTGFYPATGELLEEIPQSVYYRDALEDDVTGERSPQTTSILQIIQPPEGTYRVVVTGLKQGTYTLSVSAFSQDGSGQPELSIQGDMDIGSTSAFQVQFVSSPGAVSRLIVAIDIKPGSDPNSINCKNPNGVVSVAILTTDEFDATTVDHTTVQFGPSGATEIHSNKNGLSRHEEDVDGDGDTDLVFHFRFGDTGIQCADTQATLTGNTLNGTPISGTDAIRTVN